MKMFKRTDKKILRKKSIELLAKRYVFFQQHWQNTIFSHFLKRSKWDKRYPIFINEFIFYLMAWSLYSETVFFFFFVNRAQKETSLSASSFFWEKKDTLHIIRLCVTLWNGFE